MINIQTCDDCVHIKVCGKRKKYDAYIKEISKVSIYPGEASVLYATDCSDVVIDVGCVYYKRERMTEK